MQKVASNLSISTTLIYAEGVAEWVWSDHAALKDCAELQVHISRARCLTRAISRTCCPRSLGSPAYCSLALRVRSACAPVHLALHTACAMAGFLGGPFNPSQKTAQTWGPYPKSWFTCYSLKMGQNQIIFTKAFRRVLPVKSLALSRSMQSKMA